MPWGGLGVWRRGRRLVVNYDDVANSMRGNEEGGELFKELGLRRGNNKRSGGFER